MFGINNFTIFPVLYARPTGNFIPSADTEVGLADQNLGGSDFGAIQPPRYLYSMPPLKSFDFSNSSIVVIVYFSASGSYFMRQPWNMLFAPSSS